MHGISTVAALALLGLASAAPAPARQQKRQSEGTSFIVKVAGGNTQQRNGPAAYAQALSKYGGSAPVTVGTTTNDAVGAADKVVTGAKAASTVNTSANAETGEVSAASVSNDVEYVSPVVIGGQNITMDFDTGSSDLWVFNTGLSAAQSAGHTLYDPKKSTTFKQMTGASFAVSYGDASKVSGNTVGTDVVSIGGATVNDMVVELPSTVSPSFTTDTKSNGLVGLAFSKLNTVKPTQAQTFMEKVAPSLKEPLFTANLKKGATGSYEFGNIDASSYTGQITWAPVNSTSGFWQFTSNFYAVGSAANAKANTNASPAIADTGTSLLLMDDAVVTDYYSQVTGAKNDQQQGGFTFPCSSTLPDLYIGLTGSTSGGQMNEVPGTLLNYAPVGTGSTTCFGGLQSNQGTGIQILGDVLFKSAFVIFNQGNSSLGFAQHTAN